MEKDRMNGSQVEEEDGGTKKRRKMGNKGSNYTSLKVQCSLFTNMIKHVFRCVTVCVCVFSVYVFTSESSGDGACGGHGNGGSVGLAWLRGGGTLCLSRPMLLICPEQPVERSGGKGGRSPAVTTSPFQHHHVLQTLQTTKHLIHPGL